MCINFENSKLFALGDSKLFALVHLYIISIIMSMALIFPLEKGSRFFLGKLILSNKICL